jgi:hypothetical protein
MRPEIKKLWAGALRSGRYRQGKYTLRRGDEFCCLGVLCDLAIQQGLDLRATSAASRATLYDGQRSGLPARVMKWAGLDRDFPPSEWPLGWVNGGCPVPLPRAGGTLAYLNDSGRTFHEIAAAIEESF